MKKILIISSLVIIVAIAIRFSIVKFGEFQRGKQLAATRVPVVSLDSVKEEEISNSIEIPGRIQSQDKVDLVARIDGYLQKRHFKEGDFVKEGQVLLTIEPTQYLNNLNKARADLKTAQANLFKAQQDYNRGAELVKKDFISKSTYDGLKSAKDGAIAQVEAASAQLAEAQRNYSYTQIKSPVSGKIGSLIIQEGNYVSMASGVLATVVKTNPIYVKYSVDSKQFDELRNLGFLPKKGEKINVEVILSNEKVYPIKGVQDFFDNQISTTHGTIDFRATFENPDNMLISGDFVKVKVYSNQKEKALVVPQDIVMQDAKGKYVYVVAQDETVQPKHFKEKGQYGKYWIVQSGLEKDEKFIATNITKIMPKQKVKIQEEQEKTNEDNK